MEERHKAETGMGVRGREREGKEERRWESEKGESRIVNAEKLKVL